MKKLLAIFGLFRKGSEVASPAKWKNGQITVNAIVGFLAAAVALAKSYGVEIDITHDQIAAIAGGVLALFNVVFTLITSKKVGLPAKIEDSDDRPWGSGSFD